MQVTLDFFADDRLNVVALDVIDLGVKSRESAKRAMIEANNAFHYRWQSGKIIYENLDLIKEVCGTQEEFAKTIGETPSVISNNKRGYVALLEVGADTWEKVLDLLEQRRINPVVSNFEKVGSLLAAPASDTTGKEQVQKDLKRLETLASEANEILARMEPGSKPKQLQEAFEVVEEIQEIQNFLNRFDQERSKWKSEKYLEFIRSFGWDMVIDKPCERCDPHHTLPNGGSGSVGEKLADFWTIPVSRETHNLIESGLLVLNPEEVLRIQHYCMSAFIQLNLKKLK